MCRVRRAGIVTAIAFGIFVFLGISLLLARGLTGAGAERSRVLDVLRAQARGDAAAVLADLPACRRERGLRARSRGSASRGCAGPGGSRSSPTRRATQLSLTRQTGSGRVAWRAGTACRSCSASACAARVR